MIYHQVVEILLPHLLVLPHTLLRFLWRHLKLLLMKILILPQFRALPLDRLDSKEMLVRVNRVVKEMELQGHLNYLVHDSVNFD